LTVAGRRELLEILAAAREIGLLGPGPIEAHLDHTAAWAGALGDPPASFLDLGSGGGVPGLVLARAWPGARGVLLDSRSRSVGFLSDAVATLGLADRIEVVEGRAEAEGREARLREGFPLVVARGFAAPPVTAECASAFLAVGGRLSVSEPPGGDPARWPEDGLARLGLGPAETLRVDEASFVVIQKVQPLDERWPRRVGRPGHRPIW
jgi:16S rRNA (guanine527-N7)-methyltransferase